MNALPCRAECVTAVEYTFWRSFAEVMKKDKFDSIVKKKVVFSPSYGDLCLVLNVRGYTLLHKHFTKKYKDDGTLVPGDYSLYQNIQEYKTKAENDPEMEYSNENCFYGGFSIEKRAGVFHGLGLINMTEEELNSSFMRALKVANMEGYVTDENKLGFNNKELRRPYHNEGDY
jgi:CobQ-like glutamine amidotransferase family enzyme